MAAEEISEDGNLGAVIVSGGNIRGSRRLRSGAFHSIEEVIHHALRVQEAEESWLVLHKREVGEKLARAMEEFDQGVGIPARQVRER